MNVLIAGCGYVGIRVAERLHTQRHNVFGLRRSPPGSAPFIQWSQGDLTRRTIDALPAQIDSLVLAAGLRRDTEKNYQALFVNGYQWLINYLKAEQHPLKRIIMVSTTSVFAECNGGWVDETSPVNPDKSPARYYLAAEDIVRNSGISSSVVRLSGIYGPDRVRLIREVREGRARRQNPPPHYLNHIHADDAAGAVSHLLQLDSPDPLYVASDLDPADRNDVLQWISDQLRLGPLPEAPDNEPRVVRGGNKRCRTERLVEAGYTFAFPTYREGYANLLH